MGDHLAPSDLTLNLGVKVNGKGQDVNRITELGRPAIIAASICRNDGVAAAIELTNPLVVHSECRKSYTRHLEVILVGNGVIQRQKYASYGKKCL